MSKKRFTLLSAVHLLLIKGGKILLLRRKNTGYEDGKYSLVAGHLDGEEKVTIAMAREVREEVGIKIEPQDLHVVHVMHRNATTDTGTRTERIDFFLSAKKWTGEPKIQEIEKCDDLRWFPLVSLPRNTIPYIRFAIGQILQKNFFSEFGW